MKKSEEKEPGKCCLAELVRWRRGEGGGRRGRGSKGIGGGGGEEVIGSVCCQFVQSVLCFTLHD